MSAGGLSRLLGREATALGWMTAGRSAFESRDMHGYGTPAVPRSSLTPGDLTDESAVGS